MLQSRLRALVAKAHILAGSQSLDAVDDMDERSEIEDDLEIEALPDWDASAAG